jgi:signal transduction histidine kinase
MPSIRGSASELKEVFVNIILNALDAMPQGGRLRIATETKGAFATVSLTDNGIGMANEVQGHIFEPFFTTKGASGTGLGLAVSYSIIERHGGRIEARSSPGRGTTFVISLPAARSEYGNSTRDRRTLPRGTNMLALDDDLCAQEALI